MLVAPMEPNVNTVILMPTEVALTTGEVVAQSMRISFLFLVFFGLCLAALTGCATHSYNPSGQFSKYGIGSAEGRIGLRLGIEVRDTLPRKLQKTTNDDISDVTAAWVTRELSKQFSAVADLNAHPKRRDQVDAILAVNIENIHIDAQGLFRLSKGLAVFDGISLLHKNYAIEHAILANAELAFRLLNPSNGLAIWEYRAHDNANDQVWLADKHHLIFDAIATAIEHFVYSSDFLSQTRHIEQQKILHAAEPALREPKVKYTLSSQGSGCLLDPRYVVTSFHLVEGGTSIAVRAQGGRPIKARLVMSDRLNDLALLELSEEAEGRKRIRLATTDLQVGEDIFVLEFPLTNLVDDSVKITKGLVNSTADIDEDPRMYQIKAGIQNGNSGGPVVNEYGEVVGIVANGDLPENVTYAVKSQYVQALIQSANIDLSDIDTMFNSYRTPMSARKVAQIISESVVHIESFKW